MHKPIAFSPLLLLAASAAQAHTGEHGGTVLALLAHLGTHADHWLPALAVLSVMGVALRLSRPRAGERPPKE